MYTIHTHCITIAIHIEYYKFDVTVKISKNSINNKPECSSVDKYSVFYFLKLKIKFWLRQGIGKYCIRALYMKV